MKWKEKKTNLVFKWILVAQKGIEDCVLHQSFKMFWKHTSDKSACIFRTYLLISI